MIIGIFGDTHDHIPYIRKAVEVLAHEEAGIVLHAGDYIAPFVIPEIAKAGVPVVGVFGNNDGDCPLLLTRCLEQGNIEIRGYFAELGCDGQKLHSCTAMTGRGSRSAWNVGCTTSWCTGTRTKARLPTLEAPFASTREKSAAT